MFFKSRGVVRISKTLILFVSFLLTATVNSQATSDKRTFVATVQDYPPAMVVCCPSRLNLEQLLDKKTRPLTEAEAEFVFSGPARELVSELAIRMDHQLNWKVESFSASMSSMKNGSVHLIPWIYASKERMAFMRFAGPVNVDPAAAYFLINRKKHGDIVEFKDLYRLKLADEKDALTTPEIDDNPKLNILRFNSRIEALDAVLNGSADALIDSNLQRLLQIKKQGRAATLDVATFSFSYERPIYIGISKKLVKEEDAIQIDKLIEEFFSDGTMKQIFKSYDLPTPKYHAGMSVLRPNNSNAE